LFDKRILGTEEQVKSMPTQRNGFAFIAACVLGCAAILAIVVFGHSQALAQGRGGAGAGATGDKIDNGKKTILEPEM